jgi:hypothetical protein
MNILRSYLKCCTIVKKNKEMLQYFKELLEDGGRGYFSKNLLRLSL